MFEVKIDVKMTAAASFDMAAVESMLGIYITNICSSS